MENISFSPIERAALPQDAPRSFADERVAVIVVDNFPTLGKLVALRFLEWVRTNPEGVICLPTGKTPEHFIRWVEHLRQRWDERDTAAMLEASGFPYTPEKPNLSGLRFVQIDEFFPMESERENSFNHYIRRFYLTPAFGLDPARALLMDASRIGLPSGWPIERLWPDGTADLDLRHRVSRSRHEQVQQQALSRIDQWCQEYEDRIRQMGGIGFFLGGIGPDGHIGFNARGSSHYSTTRLCPTNYETQAAAATDLGGIEVARQRHVLTIGLETITWRPDAVTIVMAAGEAKAAVVADAILSLPDVKYPATVLQRLDGARFYLTSGAAHRLPMRARHGLLTASRAYAAVGGGNPGAPSGRTGKPGTDSIARDRVISDLSLKLGKPLIDLSTDDFRVDAMASALLEDHSVDELVEWARLLADQLAARVEAGVVPNKAKRFIHTEPHHDDIMLGYLTPLIRHTRDASNQHWFVTLTSGFTSVTNSFLDEQAAQAERFLHDDSFPGLMAEGYFGADRSFRDRDVWQYLDGVAADSPEMIAAGEARRFLRDLVSEGVRGREGFTARIAEIRRYASNAWPGQKDPPDIQRLKGMRREWEAECLWGYLSWGTERVRHLRMGFYTGDIFTEEPTLERDVPPIAAQLDEIRPDIVTVALDPEGSGPDTHYKSLQAVAAALRQYAEAGKGEPEIWGYRNVWYRFHPVEANCWTPVSLNMLATMEKAFLSAFASQRSASFPSHALDGPFCDLARRIQVEQYQAAKTLLGWRWFHEHPNPLIRAARALVFLRTMPLSDFIKEARDLRRMAEG